MIRLLIALIVVYLTALACANIGTVEGGPVDKDPPEVLSTVPENEGLFFDKNSFIIFFDEFLKPGSISNDITVSPPLKSKVKGSIRGKSIVVEWEDTLKENTTYVFQFGDGIKDLNEGNILKNYLYVFSTGDHIDSLTVTGKVRTVEDKSPLEDAIVGLYTWNGEKNDSTPILEKPYYYTMSESSGSFTLRYLKEGEYRLVVFEDENGNFKYDPDLEKGGFLPYPINPANDEHDMLEVRAFTPIPKLRKTEERMTHPQGVRMVFNRPVDTMSIDVIYPTMDAPKIVMNASSDTATLWFEKEITDTMQFVYTTRTTVDTVNIKKRTLKEFKYKHKTVFGTELTPNIKASFTANIPVIDLDSTGVLIKRDSVQFHLDSVEVNQDGSYTIYFPRKGMGEFNISFPPNAFTYWDNTKNKDSVRLKFDIPDKEDLGKLEITVNPGRADSLIIDIFTGETLVKTQIITDTAVITLPYIKPGGYKMQAVVDWNGNGKWDPGNLLQNLLPEPIIVNSDEVQIKANWEIEYTWNIPAEDIMRPEDYLPTANDTISEEVEEKIIEQE